MSQENIYRLTLNSIVAVSIRDMMERYGRSNIGFLWAFVEPMLLAVGVLVLWSATKGQFEHGISIITMVFTGYMPLTLWRHVTGVAPGLFLRSFSLLYHRSITLADILVARIVCEFAATTTSTLLIFFVLRTFGLIDPFERLDLVVASWLLMLWMSAAALCLLATLCAIYHWLDRFFLAFQYLLIPISGSFFLLEWVSPSAQYYLSFNPLIHSYEMLREGFMGTRITTYYTPWYPIVCGAVCFAIAIALMPRARNELSGQ